MRSLNFALAVMLAGALLCCGCGKGETRDPNVDAGGPVVNPNAPGVKGMKKSMPTSGHLYQALPDMKTGIPK